MNFLFCSKSDQELKLMYVETKVYIKKCMGVFTIFFSYNVKIPQLKVETKHTLVRKKNNSYDSEKKKPIWYVMYIIYYLK